MTYLTKELIKELKQAIETGSLENLASLINKNKGNLDEVLLYIFDICQITDFTNQEDLTILKFILSKIEFDKLNLEQQIKVFNCVDQLKKRKILCPHLNNEINAYLANVSSSLEKIESDYKKGNISENANDFNREILGRLILKFCTILPQIYLLLSIKNQNHFQNLYKKFSLFLNYYIFYDGTSYISKENSDTYIEGRSLEEKLELIWISDTAIENLFMLTVKIPPQDSDEFLTILMLAQRYKNNFLLTRIFSRFNNKPDSPFSVSKEFIIQHDFLLIFVLMTQYVDIQKLLPDAQNNIKLQLTLNIQIEKELLDIRLVNSILKYNLLNKELVKKMMSKMDLYVCTGSKVKHSQLIKLVNSDINHYPENILGNPDFVDYIISTLNNGKISPTKIYQTLLKVTQYYKPALGVSDSRQRQIAKILKDCSSNVPEIKVNEIVKPQQLPNNTPKGKTTVLSFFDF